MNIPIEIFIFTGVFLGAAIGYFGAFLIYHPKLRRAQKDSWAAARLFYTRAKSHRSSNL